MSQGTTKGVPIDVDSTMAQNSDQLVPSQKAVKAYIDGSLGTSWTEAVRDASGITTAGYKAYNTDRDRWEFYEPFWGWHPIALTPSAMRDWGFEYIEEFHLSTPSSFWGGVAVNAGSVSAISGTFGRLTISTGTNTNGGYVYRGTTGAIEFGTNLYRFDTFVNVPTNGSGTETFQVICGFADTFTAANQVDGIYFLYDSQGTSTGSAASGNWQIVTASNSVRTFTTTSVAIDNANYQKLRIDVNAAGTEVKFYINNTLVGTHTTNIPTGASRTATSGIYLQKSAGTTARTMSIDYIYLKTKFTTPR